MSILLGTFIDTLMGTSMSVFVDVFGFCLLCATPMFRAGKEPINKETHQHIFHGTVPARLPGLPPDCPGLYGWPQTNASDSNYVTAATTLLRDSLITRARCRPWPGEGSTVQWIWSPPSPGGLKALLFHPYSTKYKTRVRRARVRGSEHSWLNRF